MDRQVSRKITVTIPDDVLEAFQTFADTENKRLASAVIWLATAKAVELFRSEDYQLRVKEQEEARRAREDERQGTVFGMTPAPPSRLPPPSYE